MKLPALLLVAVITMVTGGCATWWRKPPLPPKPSPDAKYEKYDVESLAVYSGDVVAMPDSGRESECEHVRALNQRKPGLGTRLHLVAVQSVAESCGDYHQALDLLRESRVEVRDASVLGWVRYLEALIGNLAEERDVRTALENRLKHVSAKANRNRRQAKAKESELKTLQEKLDALKSIEQSLGGSRVEH